MIDTNLFQAIRQNENDVFFSRIEEEDLNQTNESGQNLLHEAIACRNAEIGFKLINLGISLNHVDSNLQTPLHYVAQYGIVELAEKILSNGGNLGVSDRFGNQPLWVAVFNARGNYDLVQLFLRFNPNVSHKNIMGFSPLDFARQIGDRELIGLLESAI